MKRSSGSGKPRSRTRGGSSTALKSDPNVGNIPVIMVTPVHESGIGVSLGASGFVTKPVDRAKLRALLNRFCNPDSGPVLVVDDDPDSRDLARHAIEQLGLKAVEAENGAVALDWLADHSPPSLILLDIMMPVTDGVEFLDLFRRNVAWSDVPVVVVTAKELTGKDRDVLDLVLLDVMTPQCNGYEVLERKGANRRLSEVPVVMLSAQGEIDSVVRCIELGAVDFLQKPFNPVLLRARVGATLEKKRLRDEGARHLVRLEQELDAGRKLQMAMVPTIFPPHRLPTSPSKSSR